MQLPPCPSSIRVPRTPALHASETVRATKQVLMPHLLFAGYYIQCGCTCLIAACVFMHASRVTPVRPWPLCAVEVIWVNVAALIGVTATWGSSRLHGGAFSNRGSLLKGGFGRAFTGSRSPEWVKESQFAGAARVVQDIDSDPGDAAGSARHCTPLRISDRVDASARRDL